MRLPRFPSGCWGLLLIGTLFTCGGITVIAVFTDYAQVRQFTGPEPIVLDAPTATAQGSAPSFEASPIDEMRTNPLSPDYPAGLPTVASTPTTVSSLVALPTATSTPTSTGLLVPPGMGQFSYPLTVTAEVKQGLTAVANYQRSVGATRTAIASESQQIFATRTAHASITEVP